MHEYSSYPTESDEELLAPWADDPTISINDLVRSYEFIGYRLWSCAGCDEWTVEQYYVVGLEDDLFDRNVIDFRLIPERTKFQVEGKQFHQLPPTLEGIYREVLHSYNYNLPILCGVGIRALLEGICSDQEIRGKNLVEKIDGLSSVLPSNIVFHLHDLRLLGNDAAHDLIPPDQEELHLAINLIEDILNFLYELDYKAWSLTEWRKKKRADNNVGKDTPTNPDDDSG